MLTPFFMGTVVGAIAAGNVPAAGNGDAFSSWLRAAAAADRRDVRRHRRLPRRRLPRRRRAPRRRRRDWSATSCAAPWPRRAVAGVAAAVGLVELHAEARYVFDRLIDQGLPLVILSALCGARRCSRCSLRGAPPRPLRPLAAGAVVAVIWGWGVAQFPYLLPTSLKIGQAAAPDPTLDAVFVVFASPRSSSCPPSACSTGSASGTCSVSEAGAIRAVLFDIDGTLLVTGGAGGVAWQRAFEELHGVEANIAEHTDAGMTDPEIAAIVFREVIGREGSQEERAKAIAGYLTPPRPTRSPSPPATG